MRQLLCKNVQDEERTLIKGDEERSLIPSSMQTNTSTRTSDLPQKWLSRCPSSGTWSRTVAEVLTLGGPIKGTISLNCLKRMDRLRMMDGISTLFPNITSRRLVLPTEQQRPSDVIFLDLFGMFGRHILCFSFNHNCRQHCHMESSN